MAHQLSLLSGEQPTLAVPICPEVLRSGASASDADGQPLFGHRYLPALPPTLAETGEWRAALDIAEEALRSEGPARAVPCLRRESRYAGYRGTSGPGTPFLTASTRGVDVGFGHGSRLVRWPRLVAALTERREVEPEIARARDLAEAYRLLDYYGAVYKGLPWADERTPVPLVRALAAEARLLGGTPDLLRQHTTYMREGTAP